MSGADLHDVYRALSDAIDAAGPERESLLLARLALLLAERLDDPDAALTLIAEAQHNLDGMRLPE